jgi:fatty-acyl-CoA synthase
MPDDLPARIAHARSEAIGDLLRRSAARDPGKTAIVYRDLRQTYAELDATVNRTAAALAARGIGPGDRVVLFSHNNHAFVVAYFALARLGAVSVPVNFVLTADEVAYVLAHSGAAGLIAEDALVPVAEQALAGPGGPAGPGAAGGGITVRGVIPEHGQEQPGWEPVTDWMTHADPTPPDITVGGDDLAQLIHTSGTESRPKGAMLSHHSLIAQYVSCVVDGEMTGADVEVHSLPLYHCAQLHCCRGP